MYIYRCMRSSKQRGFCYDFVIIFLLFCVASNFRVAPSNPFDLCSSILHRNQMRKLFSKSKVCAVLAQWNWFWFFSWNLNLSENFWNCSNKQNEYTKLKITNIKSKRFITEDVIYSSASSNRKSHLIFFEENWILIKLNRPLCIFYWIINNLDSFFTRNS